MGELHGALTAQTNVISQLKQELAAARANNSAAAAASNGSSSNNNSSKQGGSSSGGYSAASAMRGLGRLLMRSGSSSGSERGDGSMAAAAASPSKAMQHGKGGPGSLNAHSNAPLPNIHRAGSASTPGMGGGAGWGSPTKVVSRGGQGGHDASCDAMEALAAENSALACCNADLEADLEDTRGMFVQVCGADCAGDDCQGVLKAACMCLQGRMQWCRLWLLLST